MKKKRDKACAVAQKGMGEEGKRLHRHCACALRTSGRTAPARTHCTTHIPVFHRAQHLILPLTLALTHHGISAAK